MGVPVIRMLIIDDQALLRGSFWVLIETTPDLEVVGEAPRRGGRTPRASRTSDMVLMDARMSGMDGIEATAVDLRFSTGHLGPDPDPLSTQDE
jgi:DNA-binding NarL/FixJ family response regulator